MHTLASTLLRRATNGRATRDNHPGQNRRTSTGTGLVLGISGMLHYAVGIWPSRDNVWSNSSVAGHGGPEPMPETQALMALLAGGPFGPSDAAGAGNRSLIMRSCRDDGVLLRADKPITMLDSAFAAVPFEEMPCNTSVPDDLTCAAVNVWATHSDIGARRFGYILGLDLVKPFEVRPRDILPRSEAETEAQQFRVWEYWSGVGDDGEDRTMLADAAQPFAVPAPPLSSNEAVITSTYHVLAPVLENGWTYLGEPGKIVAASSRRVSRIESTAHEVSVCLLGSRGEEILAALRSPNATIHRVVCHVDSSAVPHEDVEMAVTCSGDVCRCAPGCPPRSPVRQTDARAVPLKADDALHPLLGGPSTARTKGQARRQMVLASAQYVVCNLISTTLFYRELYRLTDYPQFSNMLNTAGSVVTMGVLTLLLMAQPCSTTEGVGGWCCALGLDSLQWGEGVAAALRGRLFSLRVLALLGLLSALANMLQLMAIDSLGSRYSTLTTLINQSTIPFTMILSRLMLGARYSAAQVGGAAVVIAGVAVAVSPSLGAPAAGDATAPGLGRVVAWMAVFVVSCVPQSLVEVVIEEFLPLPDPAQHGVQATTVQSPRLRDVLLRSAALVTLMNVASLPFNFVAGALATLFQDGGLAPLWEDYGGGWGCLRGNAEWGMDDGSQADDGSCVGTWVYAATFIPMGGLYLISQILVIHYAGASFMFLVTAMCLPLQNVVLSQGWAMGSQKGTLTAATYVAIVIVTIGMVAYGAASTQQRDAGRDAAARHSGGSGGRAELQGRAVQASIQR